MKKNELFDDSIWQAAIQGKDLPFQDVKWIKNIPRDPRHHSKIDYGRLGLIVV